MLKQKIRNLANFRRLRKEIAMDIPIDVKVSCTDGTCGESTVVILDPTTEKVTHIVVKENQFPNDEHLVPVSMIKETTPDSIQIACSKEKLAKLDKFIEHEFIRTDIPYEGYPSFRYRLWPYVQPMGIGYIDIKSEHIPPGELAIHRGAHVQAVDGRVGKVDEFLINPINGHVSHIVLREGHLWNKKEVSIPVAQVDHYSDNTVFLKLDKSAIEALPEIPIKRWIG
jgi:sporulation protein YlmC with PRC-barrel domain